MEHNKAEVLSKLEAKLTSKYGEKLAKMVIVKLAPRLVPGLSQALVLKDIYDTLKDLEEFGSLIEQKRSEDASKKQEKSKVVAAASGGSHLPEGDDSDDDSREPQKTADGKITRKVNDKQLEKIKNVENFKYKDHGYKHVQSKTVKDAINTSKEGEKIAQYHPDFKYQDVVKIEQKAIKDALEKGEIFNKQGSEGTRYVFYKHDRTIGYSNGKATEWVRVELTENGPNQIEVHSHPVGLKEESAIKYINELMRGRK